jgi:hypothetical protein
MRFTAVETYEVQRPEFEWSARLHVAGLPVGRATDSLADGRGRMHVRLLGLFDLVDLNGPEIDQGSLVRWLNETMWFPAVWATDLITWEPVGAMSAIGSVAVGDLSVQAEFLFDEEGRFVDFRADRYRQEQDAFRPWSTPISAHSRFGDLELPSAGSGVWHLDDGELEYVRVRITDLRHEPSRNLSYRSNTAG